MLAGTPIGSQVARSRVESSAVGAIILVEEANIHSHHTTSVKAPHSPHSNLRSWSPMYPKRRSRVRDFSPQPWATRPALTVFLVFKEDHLHSGSHPVLWELSSCAAKDIALQRGHNPSSRRSDASAVRKSDSERWMSPSSGLFHVRSVGSTQGNDGGLH